MINAFSQDLYESICKQWVHTITLLSESQTHMWTPLSCSFTLVNRFAHDKELQDKLFKETNRKLIFIDGYEAINPLWEDFENQFFQFLPDTTSHADIDSYMSTHSDTLFGLFLVGFDTAIKHDHLELLKHVGSLLEKYPQLSLILLTEQNIIDSPIYTELLQKHMIIENMYYQPVLSKKDTILFLENLGKSWNFMYPEGMMQTIAEHIGGHPLLLEEAVRIVRETPTITPEALFTSPTLIRKAHMIFTLLSDHDQEIIRAIAEKKPCDVSEYLSGTGLVHDGTIGLSYWEYLNTHHPEAHIFLNQQPIHPPIAFKQYLTSVERQVFEMLLEKNGIITTREDIAKVLWKDAWEDKYSDWAIDQTMHRLREKLTKYQTSYEVKTKKGEGFLFLNKD